MAKKCRLGDIDEAREELLGGGGGGGGVDTKGRQGGAIKAPKRESRVRTRRKRDYRVQVLDVSYHSAVRVHQVYMYVHPHSDPIYKDLCPGI